MPTFPLSYRIAFTLLVAGPLAAGAEPVALSDCSPIADDSLRLACFDRLAARANAGPAEEEANEQYKSGPPHSTSAAIAPSSTESGSGSFLAKYWEIGPENKRGTFDFRPHQPNFLMATYTVSPNNAPYLPFRRLVPGAGNLSHAELVFQLSFKTKFVENALGTPADLWFGYTQQSFWQAGNSAASSPFRETNYRPELMAVAPVDFTLLGMRARFLNVGFLHESNGQGSTLSRSWNRVYAQLGMERGDFSLLTRVWQRVNEPAAEDDNPDIVDYLGRGDVTGTYRWKGNEFSVLARYNFETDRGAAQLSWAFPIADKLKGYVQYFSGYGHSLIDYNHYQHALGVGVLLSY